MAQLKGNIVDGTHPTPVQYCGNGTTRNLKWVSRARLSGEAEKGRGRAVSKCGKVFEVYS